MRTDELDFDLPRERIATRPAEPRDSARLLVVRTDDHEHRTVRDLPELLGPDDTLVFNRSRVLPARFVGRNLDTGGKVEGLWTADAEPALDGGPDRTRRWVVLLKARRHRPGFRIALGEADSGVTITIVDRADRDGWLVDVDGPPGSESEGTADLLARAGMTPLPPYILSRRKETAETVDDAFDRAAYQTLFAAKAGAPAGSVAAPTAGLHFTPGLLDRLAARGVRTAEVTLHVGAGTFKGIETDTVEDHAMHAEWCAMDRPALDAVFGDPARRVVAVGSTSTRTVESYAAHRDEHGSFPEALETDLMITPGYRWRRVGGVLTNFHLPRSTLIAMVAAAVPGGIERVRALYAEAVEREYRFFSYGDAMLILPDG